MKYKKFKYLYENINHLGVINFLNTIRLKKLILCPYNNLKLKNDFINKLVFKNNSKFPIIKTTINYDTKKEELLIINRSNCEKGFIENIWEKCSIEEKGRITLWYLEKLLNKYNLRNNLYSIGFFDADNSDKNYLGKFMFIDNRTIIINPVLLEKMKSIDCLSTCAHEVQHACDYNNNKDKLKYYGLSQNKFKNELKSYLKSQQLVDDYLYNLYLLNPFEIKARNKSIETLKEFTEENKSYLNSKNLYNLFNLTNHIKQKELTAIDYFGPNYKIIVEEAHKRIYELNFDHYNYNNIDRFF